MDEFSEKFQKGGGGSFSIQKFILQIFAIIDDTLVMNFRKNLQYDFPKNEGGGSKTVWNFSENSSVLEGKGVPYSLIAWYQCRKFNILLPKRILLYFLIWGLSFRFPLKILKLCYYVLALAQKCTLNLHFQLNLAKQGRPLSRSAATSFQEKAGPWEGGKQGKWERRWEIKVLETLLMFLTFWPVQWNKINR